MSKDTPTLPPGALELEQASALADTATLALLNQAHSAGLHGNELDDLIHTLEDHAHALQRTANGLRAKRLRLAHPCKLVAR